MKTPMDNARTGAFKEWLRIAWAEEGGYTRSHSDRQMIDASEAFAAGWAAAFGQVKAKGVLKHLERADHDEMGEFHTVHPSPGTWDIEIDKPGCEYGHWYRPDGKLDGDSGTEKEDTRVMVTECTCGYNDAVAMLKEAELGAP